jgi:hypothetical protein
MTIGKLVLISFKSKIEIKSLVNKVSSLKMYVLPPKWAKKSLTLPK